MDEMEKIQQDLDMDTPIDPDRLMKAANTFETAGNQWMSLRSRLDNASDYQTREYALFSKLHMQANGVDPDQMALLLMWQGGCLRSMARNIPPPMPPQGLDMQAVIKMKDANDSMDSTPTISSMSSAQLITAPPFDVDAVLKEPVIAEEHAQLCDDHLKLIEFGARYDSFDAAGKIAYIDQIEKIEERWDVYFARFGLMGKLNDDFTKQCEAFLASVKMNEREYRGMLQKTHDVMRAQAERER